MASTYGAAMLQMTWTLLKDTVNGFIDDDALSRGAAIAYYTIFSLAPVLVIVIAIAGLAFGEEAARGAVTGQIEGLMGHQAAEAIQTMIQSAGNTKSGVIATAIGLVTLMIAASGVFSEMQAALNVVWKATPKEGTVGRLVKARATSLGLVAALGFLMMVSLVISAGLAAMSDILNAYVPGAAMVMRVVNFVISLSMISVLFGAIYKILPDKPIEWRDVVVGAVTTALLFTIGKTAISLYIGSSTVASSFGAAGALAIMLVWIYYSSQIFLLGAEFTRAFAERHGSKSPDAQGPNAKAVDA